MYKIVMNLMVKNIKINVLVILDDIRNDFGG